MEEFQEKHLYVLILCGGGGKRLWPRSRVKTPKQFIKLLGERTLFQNTVARARKVVPYSRIFVVTNFDYMDEIRKQAPHIPRENIICEPQVKDTALAMGIGALFIQKIDPLAIITNFASDHHIGDIEKFSRAIKNAASVAGRGDFLVALGIKPSFPHTGMGYIKRGRLIRKDKGAQVFGVVEFVEKPNFETAERFLREGKYFWNANLYTWKTDSILQAIRRHLPKLDSGLQKIKEALGTIKERRVIEEVYREMDSISIDYGISEKAKNLVLIPCDFSWSDVGDWKVVYDVSKKDKEGNVVIFEKGRGEYVGMETKNCLIHFSDELITTVGVEDLIIVDTKDTLLIAKKERAQDVKELVNFLKEKGKDKYL